MSVSPTTDRRGERANPHPSGDHRYDVEVIDAADGQVRVRYVRGTTAAWWITEAAWDDWKRLSAVVSR